MAIVNFDDWQEEFVDAFCSEIMSIVPDFDINEDGLSATPWCCPWYWADEAEYRIDPDPVKCGKWWAAHNAQEIAELVAEDQARKEEMEEEA